MKYLRGSTVSVTTSDIEVGNIESVLTLLPAILGLMHMMREHEPALAHIGGGLALVGLMATTVVVSIEGLVGSIPLLGDLPTPRAFEERCRKVTPEEVKEKLRVSADALQIR